MANYSLKFLLGLYPKTDQIEKRQNELRKEFEEFNHYSESDELARYYFLDKLVSSPEFISQKNYYKTLSFKGSEEERKEQEFKKLQNWHEVKFFYKYKASKELAHFMSLDKTQEIAHFEELKSFVESAEFKKFESYMKDRNKWQKTDEYRKEEEYRALKKNPHFVEYFKFINSGSYSDFQKYYKSHEIAVFEEREKYIQSKAFVAEKSAKDFKKSEAYAKYKEYLKWTKDYKHYIKLVQSPFLGAFKKLHGSEELAYFRELESTVVSPEYKRKRKEVESLRFENTDRYVKQKEYNKLATSKRITEYYKVKNSEKLAEYRNLENSKIIADYETLKAYIGSDEFRNRKHYLLDAKKWEKTDEYKQEQEYLQLKKSQKIQWFLKLKASDKFEELKTWNLLFEDDFTLGTLDRNKWITRYFWGEMLLHDTYALPGEKHLLTDGKNIQMNGSTVKILTRQEKISGKEWNPMFGFIPKEFDYTSGILCSGSSFRTKFGKIEAKIKIDNSKGIAHAFWLCGDNKTPQIDVFKYYNGKLALSTFWRNEFNGDGSGLNGIKNDSVSLSASRFSNNFFIYSLEWSPEKITWKINDIEIKSQTSHIPDEPMYLVLNSGVYDDHPVLSSGMEVDWVRCYMKN